MAFDNLLLRQCSYFYNENDTNAATDGVTSVTKDIGNGSNTCIKLPLSKLNTVWNEDVSVSAQVEVYFQPKFMGDSSGTLTTTEILATIPVEMRQSLFRLPRFYGEGADQKTVYMAEKDTDANIYLYIDASVVGGLAKTTRPDGTSILGYPDSDGNQAAVTLTFPTPTADTAGTREYTVKRLTHSITDFVTYQAGGQLTSNLLNFQKEQEMFLIQELLWTIEMDMITFTDLAGKGKIVTTLGDGYIDVRDINLSINELNDVVDSFTRTGNKQVLYRPTNAENWETRYTHELVNVEDIINYTETDPLTNGHVITWDNTAGYWTNKSVDDAAGACNPVLAENLKFCGVGSHDTIITDIVISTDTFASVDTKLMTASGMGTVIFNDLKNVSYVEGSLSTNDILKWDGSQWIAGSISAAAGPAGGDTFKFQLKTTTSPASGKFIMEDSSGNDTTVWADVVKITISTTDEDGSNVTNWVSAMDDGNELNATKGRLKVFDTTTVSKFALFNVTSVSGNSITVAPITNAVAGTTLSADDYAYITFAIAGDDGADGATGQKGDTGEQGPQGYQGRYFTSGSGAVSGNDINITWTEFDPSDGSTAAWDGNPLVISDFNDVADTGLYYIKSATIITDASNDFGQWLYELSTTIGGATAAWAINGQEEANDGSAGSTRTFQGYTYNAPAGAVGSYVDRQLGVNSVTQDTYALLPIKTNTRVFAKTIVGGTVGGQSVTKIISMQNPLVVVLCG